MAKLHLFHKIKKKKLEYFKLLFYKEKPFAVLCKVLNNIFYGC